ncbi:hypothetical protein PV327_002225 [Microctonus hyperodae]|uniref:Protein wntless n=1 Tax=Microctonus hyperodae TaxID=165561 RepID=A0AA39FF69_MICHY|nr:hypothetical protein PV327_002225 [Microctonus hyperodae]
MEDIMMNLNGKKLSIIGILIAAQFICILIGGSFYSRPYESQVIFGTICEDNNYYDSDKWYYSRGNGSCKSIDSLADYYYNSDNINENQHVVYVFQMPVSRNGIVLDYSRWQQKLVGALEIDSQIFPNQNEWEMVVRLAYRNKSDPDDAWKHYASSRVKKFGDSIYNSEAIPIFDLSNLYHDYYLLNVYFLHERKNIAEELKHVTGLSLTVINQNEGFTKIMLGLKTVFFFIVLALIIWYWERVISLSRSPAAFEYMILSLGLKIQCVVLPSMNSNQQLQFDGILYRFKFITLATFMCAFLTLGFIFYQMANDPWKWDRYLKPGITSEYFTGIYGMWNIYTISVLYFYAPLEKKTIQQQSEKQKIYTIYSPS